jgi:ABC-type lipoprotein release transport system permease subunit
VATHLIPLRGFPLARMAFNSLRRRKTALVFAMIALFIGVISLSMGMMVKDISERKISSKPGVFQGYNLTILGPAGQEITIRQAVEAQHPDAVGVEYRTALTGYKIKGRAEEDAGNSTDAASDGSLADLEPVLVGRSDPEGYIISGAHWGSQPDGVYVYRYTNVRAGSQIEVTLLDGTQRVFSVVGTYDIDYQSIKLYPPTGLLTSTDAFMQTSKPDSIAYSMQVAPEKLESTATTLGAALPGATVINLVAYAGRFMQSYRNLYILPIVMALLAMLAGLLLVANAVSLAMLERRYEIGILKTVGYSRRQILTTFGVEYGLVGVLATCVGVFLSEGFLAVMAIANHMAAVILLLSPQSLALIFFCGIGLTLITVIGITWAPASISPAAVLNNMDAG